MASKRRKNRKHYTIAVSTDYSCDKTKYYRSRFNIVSLCIKLMVTVVVLAIGLTAFEFYELNHMESRLDAFRSSIDELEAMNRTLSEEKAELQSQVTILGDTINIKMEEEEQKAKEEAERYLPTDFPLTGSATMEQQDTTVEGYVPITVFVMSDPTDVVASGDGTISSVVEDEQYGHCVTIDHGNGYVSVYRNNSIPKVAVGDKVVRGAILFVGGADNMRLGYHIIYDSNYVDPLQIIAIDG